MDYRILILKYIFISLFLGTSILKQENTLICLVITLLIIISSNLRFFYIREERAKYPILIIEMLIVTIFTVHFNLAIIFYVISLLIDLIYLKNEVNYKILFYSVCVLGVKDILVLQDKIYLIFMGVGVSVYIMMNYIKEIDSVNTNTQELYDKLRVSEDKLKKLNLEIEEYSQSALEIAVLKERNRISREVHDGVGHVLSTTMIQLAAMERVGKITDNPLGEMAGELRNFVSDSFNEVKVAIRELKPDEYSDIEGIIRISELCKNVEKFSGIDIRLTILGDKWTFEGKQIVNIYGTCKEVLSNAVKYSGASKIQIVY